MKILVINGDCIRVNSSANLCHLAYIHGLVDAGHEVFLLSASDGCDEIDPAMQIPAGVKCYSFPGDSLYKKASVALRSKKNRPAVSMSNYSKDTTTYGPTVKKVVKQLLLKLYGPHGIYATIVKNAKRFHSSVEYDYVISISTPPSSHLLAHLLLKSKHICSNHWIQIWEDPWYSDAYGFNNKDAIFKEEKRLLSYAERVCYVSPITLENQKMLFPESADKMYWQPLPSYYSVETAQNTPNEPGLFGYFGAYYPVARQLRPFYEAAVRTGIRVNICGDPSNLFTETEEIKIFPRMQLTELRPFEAKTDVLVFLCNRKGGQIPGKIYQYAATDKTILFILDGTNEEKKVLREFFEPYRRFVFCDNRVEDIEAAIEKIKRGELGDIVNRPLTDFEPKKIIEKILEEGMK